MTGYSYAEKYERYLSVVEDCIARWVGRAGDGQPVLAAMGYSVVGGGKRIRPVLMTEFFSLTPAGDRIERIMPFAVALELVHSYSLVHDDLPCMDNGLMRRGKPSTHVEFGEWQAVLAGDGLLNLAFEIMAEQADLDCFDARTVLLGIGEIAAAAGYRGMIGGQELDMSSEGGRVDEAGLVRLQNLKTGALIRAAGRTGIICGGGDDGQLAAAEKYCYDVGLLFQITDDIIDFSSNEAVSGKTGGDYINEKATFVTMFGLDSAQAKAAALCESAVLQAERLGSAFLGDFAENILRREK